MPYALRVCGPARGGAWVRRGPTASNGFCSNLRLRPTAMFSMNWTLPCPTRHPVSCGIPRVSKDVFFFSFSLVAVFLTIPAAWFSCIRFESAPERTSKLSTSIGPPRFTQTWASSVIAKQSSTQWPSVLPPSRRRHVEPHPRLPRTCHPPCSVPVARPARPSTSSTANLASHP